MASLSKDALISVLYILRFVLRVILIKELKGILTF